VPGERQEDVIERRPPEGDVVDDDPREETAPKTFGEVRHQLEVEHVLLIDPGRELAPSIGRLSKLLRQGFEFERRVIK